MGVDTQIGTSGGGASAGVTGTRGTGYYPVSGYTAMRRDAGSVERYQFNVPTLSWLQMAQILYQAGFRGADLTKFIGIAMRESAGGGTWIVGRPDGGSSSEWSFGIFGLNTKGAMWDEMKRLLPGLTDRSQLLNPIVNARVAYAMFKKYGDRPWGPYKTDPSTGRPQLATKGTDQNKAAQAAEQLFRSGANNHPFDDAKHRFNAPAHLIPAPTVPTTSPMGPPPPDPAPWAAPGLPPSTGAGAAASWTPSAGSDDRFEAYGGAAPAGPVMPAPAEMTDDQLRDFIRENYGYMSAYFDDPVLGPILREAARGGWSRDKLYGRLSQTDWWKQTSDAARKWDALEAEDKATADRMRAETGARIANIAGKAGLAFSPKDVSDMAWVATRFGWTDEQIRDAVSQHLKARWGGQGPGKGDSGHAMNLARRYAADYMVGVSQAELDDFGVRWVAEETTEADIEARMAARARSQYAGNADIIDLLDRGVKLSDAFSAHRAAIARLLEVSPESIDLTDKKWQTVLQRPTGKGTRAMTISEAQRLARQSDDFIGTDTGRRSLVGAMAMLRKGMGL